MRPTLSLVGLAAVTTSALHMAPTPLRQRAAAPLMQAPAADAPSATASSTGTAGGWQGVVANARGRAAAVKADQDATTGAMAATLLTVFNLPLIDNVVLDVLFSLILAGGVGVLAGFDIGPVGGPIRSVGGSVSSAAGAASSKVSELDESLGVTKKLGLDRVKSYSDLKAIGVAGVIAYILTELAFWAVAFPVATASFYNLNGHWPDFGVGDDRTAVLAFIFAGANVARLVVPLRLAAALAITPWTDENIVQRFGIGKGEKEDKE